jgi:hypothetical protein
VALVPLLIAEEGVCGIPMTVTSGKAVVIAAPEVLVNTATKSYSSPTTGFVTVHRDPGFGNMLGAEDRQVVPGDTAEQSGMAAPAASVSVALADSMLVWPIEFHCTES